jgi:hypothetical protein
MGKEFKSVLSGKGFSGRVEKKWRLFNEEYQHMIHIYIRTVKSKQSGSFPGYFKNKIYWK